MFSLTPLINIPIDFETAPNATESFIIWFERESGSPEIVSRASNNEPAKVNCLVYFYYPPNFWLKISQSHQLGKRWA
ncbi:MAG: hypothetical protein DWI28_06075 [Planctomycetota bacterium]|nr:MAG: hypothetical protein DWI28_06075 [Planctomycetota bacterium]